MSNTSQKQMSADPVDSVSVSSSGLERDLDAQGKASSSEEHVQKSSTTPGLKRSDFESNEAGQWSDFDDSNLPPVVICNMSPPPEPASSLPLSVQRQWEPLFGLATDTTLPNQGIKNIAGIVRILKEAGIVCCMSYEPALVYYGAKRAVFVSPCPLPMLLPIY